MISWVVAFAFIVSFGLASGHSHGGTEETPAGLKIKSSPHSVNETMARLIEVLEAKGLRILAHIKHQDNAANVNLTLPDTELLIFGNPLLGTRLMMEKQTVGIDLPMKALVYDTTNGTLLAYNEPESLRLRHNIVETADVIEKMTFALDKITDVVVAPDEEWA